jgi:hypothetical protein
MAAGCGGGTGAARSANDAPQDSASLSSDFADEPPVLDCSNDTCSRCGKGICPDGFYCDESANGGPACSWLPQCVDATGCDCITNALGEACRCEERDGGTYVTCQ